ncbi:MAG: hypothetical protein CSA29_03970 [Desulfobacterales bacterium]|nr:MAG: hypothetical protein CSA29_03970 [Desulfobacterales bacterium]
MIRILRYISFRFWWVCLGALPLEFWLLPKAAKLFPELPPLLVAAFVCVGFGMVLGWGLDRVGIRRINALIQEGKQRESAGINSRAEKQYVRASGIFDSAWISPWAARRMGPALMDTVGRFYLSSGSTHSGFEQAAIYHVLAHSKDEILAMLWLAKDPIKSSASDERETVLTALADAHYENPEVRRQLVLIFLESGRKDLSAQRLYRYFLKDSRSVKDDAIAAHIKTLIGTSQAGTDTGIIGEMGQLSTSAGTLGDVRPRAYYMPLHNGTEHGGMLKKFNTQTSLIKIFSAFTAKGGRVVGKRLWGIVSGIGGIFQNIHIRRWMRFGGICGAGICLCVFAWSTLFHMVESTPEPVQRIEIRIRKPYTIQVAAYLKSTHAQQYVAQLERKGITATVKTTGAGGKTWYLVRVSAFTDKKSAVEYGNHLKSKNIIEDFFVSNK